MNEVKEKMDVRFCPQCGSGLVEYSKLAGGAANCRVSGCSWSGKAEDLLVVPVSPGEGSSLLGNTNFVEALMLDIRKLVSGHQGLLYLKLLGHWGFIELDFNDVKGTVDRKIFSRYLAAIASGILTALLNERVKIEMEKAEERVSNESN